MMLKRSYLSLLFFMAVVAGVSLSGVAFQPGEWYLHLVKPSWTPASWLFPVVWSLLYFMIAVAGWLIFSGTSRNLKMLWVAQLVLNELWSWIFFGMHSTGLGLIDIIAMFACISALIAISYKASRVVAWLLSPYLFWVGYASTLNAAIYLLNFA